MTPLRIRQPWALARTLQRRREFAAVFDGVPEGALGDGLEIGGGDGFLASLVASRCRSFVTTDAYRPRLTDGRAAEAVGVRRVVCDATRLPFAASSFDFIFSCSLLEHIRDRPAAYREMRRCLRPGGLMLHMMPSRTWKALQMLLYYPHLAISGLDLLLDLARRRNVPPSPTCGQSLMVDRWSDERRWRFCLKTIAEGIVPQPHGEYSGHAAEWKGFGVGAWKREFANTGFAVQRVLLLPLYSGYGFGLDRLRSLGEGLRLSSHNAFFVTPDGAVSDRLACFGSAGDARLPALTPP